MDYQKYLIYIVVLVTTGILYEKYKIHNQNDEDLNQYDLVKKYLLNDSSLARKDVPILWIHASHDINARWWASFYSRNSKCVNQPYEILAIKSIIDKCGKDFKICLIDDDTFEKLLSNWTIDLNRLTGPVKTYVRELGIAQLLYVYGGFRVPPSFYCFKNLYSLYEDRVKDGGGIIGGINK